MKNEQLNMFQFTREFVQQQASAFYTYLLDEFSDSGVIADLDKIAQKRKALYVFSGIIRDFFLNRHNDIRDLDIVLTGETNDALCKTFDTYKINQFGGMKIQKYSIPLDLWFLKQTWGIRTDHLDSSPESLVNTAFFNFSAITFDYKKREFIFNDKFLNFLNSEEIDCVYIKNPYPELCIVNTIHYSEVLHCPISNHLKKVIIQLYAERLCDYTLIQEKHFGNVKYTNEYIDNFVNNLKRCIK